MLRRRVTGFTLMEVMVSLVILSIGLLGVAGLLIRGQQFNIVSNQRTQAAFLVSDLLNRIRINSDSTSGNSNGDDGEYAVSTFTNNYATTVSCDDINCIPENLAKYDLKYFFDLVKSSFPNGEARIQWDATAKRYSVIIRWMNVVSNDDACEDDGETLANKECQLWIMQL